MLVLMVIRILVEKNVEKILFNMASVILVILDRSEESAKREREEKKKLLIRKVSQSS